MAEAFSTLAGGLGILGLFNNCVELFEHIQLGRHFGNDFQTYQLKLDLYQARLLRWGTSININQVQQFANGNPEDIPEDQKKRLQLLAVTLDALKTHFEQAEKKSKGYANIAQLTSDASALVPYGEEQLEMPVRGLHTMFKKLALKSQKETSILKKAKWALYDVKQFENLVSDISDFVQSLEKLFPDAIEASRTIALREIADIKDQLSLSTLHYAAENVDNVMLQAVKSRFTSGVQNSIDSFDLADDVQLKVGNTMATNSLFEQTGIVDNTTNKVGFGKARGKANISIGNSYTNTST